MILEEGRGGFMDSAKFREVMTDLFFHGKVRELTPQEQREADKKRAEDAKASIGKGGPGQSKIDELRAFQEELRSRGQASE